MRYTPFGQKSGLQISRLGFGSMRLPMTEVAGKSVVDEALAIPMIHRAFELGVNYIDTAWFYCDHLSEYTVGKALKGWRDKVAVSTKYPFDKEHGLRQLLELQLQKLDLDYLDFYHFHGIGEWLLSSERRDEYLHEMQAAKDEGLIRNISFSFHDKPAALPKLVDLGIFSSVLCQYNLLDRSNEAGMAYAKAHGLGVVVMGPVGGGRVAGFPPALAEKLGIQVRSSAELALRFVLANPNVDCALSGMSTLAQVEENAVTAANGAPLSPAEIEGINAAMEENKRLAQLYCTGCNYCGPHCPQEINIPAIFNAMNNHRVYGLHEFARDQYHAIGVSPWVKGRRADACTDCGACEAHCPQQIQIREQLKECRATFTCAAG
jgi:predicted aldo/keto reductase-like oxidoreductase